MTGAQCAPLRGIGIYIPLFQQKCTVGRLFVSRAPQPDSPTKQHFFAFCSRAAPFPKNSFCSAQGRTLCARAPNRTTLLHSTTNQRLLKRQWYYYTFPGAAVQGGRQPHQPRHSLQKTSHIYVRDGKRHPVRPPLFQLLPRAIVVLSLVRSRRASTGWGFSSKR